MLKRCQVLLTDWMIEYLRFIAGRHDVSFSEVIRMGLAVYFTDTINAMYPRAGFGVDKKAIVKALARERKVKGRKDEFDRLASRIYFEARKAVEYRMAQEARKAKKR